MELGELSPLFATDTSPWSFAELVHGLDDRVDTSGRPLGERRATSKYDLDVEMELKPCPYRDSRLGEPMNISALRSIMSVADSVADTCRSVSKEMPEELEDHERLYAAIVALLSTPACHALNSDEPFSVHDAACYKLAAGFFSAIRGFRAAGGSGNVHTELLAHVSEKRLLHGASEVCSGPPQLIERFAESLSTSGEPSPKASTDRRERACALATQFQLSDTIRHFDEGFEHFVLEMLSDPCCEARTRLLEKRVAERRRQVRSRSQIAPPSRWIDRATPEFPSWKLNVALDSHSEANLRRMLCAQYAGFALSEDQLRVLIPALAVVLRVRATALMQMNELENRLRAVIPSSQHSGGFQPDNTLWPYTLGCVWLHAFLGARVESRGAQLWLHSRDFEWQFPTAL